MYQFRTGGNSPLGGIGSLLVAVLFLVGMFYFVKFLFTLLFWLLPVTLIATAIIDHKVILNYIGWVGGTFRRNPLRGLLVAALSIVGAPVVSVFLLGRAWLGKQFKTFAQEAQQAQQAQPENTEYVDYEEVASETMELPTLEKPKTPAAEPTKGNSYEEFF